jgi:hypothetical protein
LEAPFLFSAAIGPGERDRLADDLADAVRRLPDDPDSGRARAAAAPSPSAAVQDDADDAVRDEAAR